MIQSCQQAGYVDKDEEELEGASDEEDNEEQQNHLGTMMRILLKESTLKLFKNVAPYLYDHRFN